MEVNRNASRGLVGKREVMKQLGRARRRWDDNIKMFSKKQFCVTWIGSIWLRVKNLGGCGNDITISVTFRRFLR